MFLKSKMILLNGIGWGSEISKVVPSRQNVTACHNIHERLHVPSILFFFQLRFFSPSPLFKAVSQPFLPSFLLTDTWAETVTCQSYSALVMQPSIKQWVERQAKNSLPKQQQLLLEIIVADSKKSRTNCQAWLLPLTEGKSLHQRRRL